MLKLEGNEDFYAQLYPDVLQAIKEGRATEVYDKNTFQDLDLCGLINCTPRFDESGKLQKVEANLTAKGVLGLKQYGNPPTS